MVRLKILQVFPKFNYLGYHTPNDVVAFEDKIAEDLVKEGFAELFSENTDSNKEQKVEITTKEEKTKVRTKSVKVEDSKVEE